MDYNTYYTKLIETNKIRKTEFFKNHIFTHGTDKYYTNKKVIPNTNGIHFNFIISSDKSKNYGDENGLVVELNIKREDESLFQKLKEFRSEIENKLDIYEIKWVIGKKRCRAYSKKVVDIEDKVKWGEYVDWHINTMIRFMKVFPSYVGKLEEDKEVKCLETPTSRITYPDEVSEDFYEGGQRKIIVNAFERNKEAREECLVEYGYSCSVCSLNFEDKYGDIGKNFIHVHHLIPISDIKEKYKIDPIKDLIPVCPNCHAMLHKENPPYSVNDLKKIIEKNI